MTHRSPSKSTRTAVALTLFVAVLFAAVLVGPTRTAGILVDDEGLGARLVAMDEKAASVSDLRADFVEEKHTALLRDPMRSRGVILVRGSQTRWDTVSPDRMTLCTDTESVTLYFPSQRRAEVYPVDERMRSLIVSPIPRLSDLRRHFAISALDPASAEDGQVKRGGTLVLSLTPTSDFVREFVDRLTVWIDERLGLATQVELLDPDGDRTTIVFSNVRVNTGVSESEIACRLPAETTVVRPLEFGNRVPAPSGSTDKP